MPPSSGDSPPPDAGRALRSLPWIAVAVAIAPLLLRGYPLGHDGIFELVRIAQVRGALEGGQLPPAWTDDLYRGFGSPMLMFYAPLFSIGAALLGAATGGVAQGAALALAGTLVIAALSMRRLASVALEDAPDASGVRIATCLYALHPYLLGDALLRNASSELLGLALAPLPLAAALRLGREPARAALALAAGLGLAIPAHNITALTTLGLVLGVALIVHAPGRLRRAALPLAGGVLLGLAIAAWFWAPAFFLRGEIRTDRLLSGKFDFRNNFPPIDGIFFGGAFFAAGPLTAVALAAGLIAALRRFVLGRRDQAGRVLGAALGAAAVLLFLMTPASTAVWERLPLLPLYQFPWRLVGPLAIMGALIGGLAFADLARRLSPGRRAALEVLIVVVALLQAGRPIVAARWIPPADRARLDAALTGEAIRADYLTATPTSEFLPRSADDGLAREPRSPGGPVLSVEPPGAHVEVVEDAGTHVVLLARAPTGSAAPLRIRLARWHFPGWEARVGSGDLAPASQGEGGVVLLEGEPSAGKAPSAGRVGRGFPPPGQEPGAGEVLLEARFRGPPILRASCIASVAALLAWAACAAVLAARRRGDVQDLSCGRDDP